MKFRTLIFAAAAPLAAVGLLPAIRRPARPPDFPAQMWQA